MAFEMMGQIWDFDENEIVSSIDNLAAPPEVPEIKFRVPSTPILDSQNIENILKPYKTLIYHIQEMLLWRRPLQFGLLAFFTESFLFIIYITNMEFLQFVFFLLMNIFLIYIIFTKFSKSISFFSPDEDRINEDDQSRIYSLEEISSFISIVGSRLHTFFLGCKQKSEDPTIFGQIVWIIFLFCFFVIIVIVKTYPLLFLFLHAIMFLPGIIFHPLIYPSVHPWLQKLMRTIAPKIKDDS